MLQTPTGQFFVFFDGIPLKNKWQKLPDYNKHNLVNGRYCFKFKYKNDNCQHILKCILEANTNKAKFEYESGENLIALSLYSGDFVLTIGAEGEDLKEWNKFYDYGITVLPTGLQYDIHQNTKSQIFRFGIAWVLKKNDKEDVRTWLAADPTAFKLNK